MIKTLVPAGCAVRVIDLPYSVGAMVSVDENGYASIYINARLSVEKQRHCLKHELFHLENDDIYNGKSIQQAEADADSLKGLNQFRN